MPEHLPPRLRTAIRNAMDGVRPNGSQIEIPEPPTVEQRDRIAELRLANSDDSVQMSEVIWDDRDGTDDPYKNCEKRCNHDLVNGILVEDLLGDIDGPYHTDTVLHIGRR